jgi:hypothetical protein
MFSFSIRHRAINFKDEIYSTPAPVDSGATPLSNSTRRTKKQASPKTLMQKIYSLVRHPRWGSTSTLKREVN